MNDKIKNKKNNHIRTLNKVTGEPKKLKSGKNLLSLLWEGYLELRLMNPSQLKCIRSTLHNLVYILHSVLDQCIESSYIT